MQPIQSDFYLTRSNFIKCKKGNISDFYDIDKKELGRGAYGTVFTAKLKNSQKVRAIKQIRKKTIKYPQTFINEIEILKKLDHPNIIKIYETFQDSENYFVVTDLCEGGELFDRLSDEGNFSEAHARQIFRQILYALNYCHGQKIAHRDLKPQNFLFMRKGDYDLKVIDFGLSFNWKENMNLELKERRQNKLIGTSYYIAPEILKSDYDERCDIWSLGVILYILVTAVPPFDGQTDRQILKSVSKQTYTMDIPEMKKISFQLKDLIRKMLLPADERITIQKIFDHPWMKNEEPNKNVIKLNYGKIINFSKYSKIKKFAISYIASQMPSKQIQKLGKIFKEVDLNHDGFLTTQELKIALEQQKQKVSIQQLQKLLACIDTDHNGKINYTQFVASTLQNSLIFKQQNLMTVFKMLDSDGNGVVSPSQLRQALSSTYVVILAVNSQMKSEVIDEIIKQCDKNNDGMIDFKEFLNSISQI